MLLHGLQLQLPTCANSFSFTPEVKGTNKCYCTWNSNFLVILSTCHIMQDEELSWWMGGWYGRLLSNKLPWHVDPFTISTNWVSSELMFNQLELNHLEVFPIFQVTHFEILPNWNLLGWICEIWLKLWSLVEIVKFGWNCEIWSNLWYLIEIMKFGRNCEIWLKLWN